MVYSEQLPPHDDGAEEAVVGSLLIDGEAVARIGGALRPEDVWGQRPRWVYEACLALFRRDEPVNQISVADELSRRQRLAEVGGLPYLSHLIAVTPTSVYAEHYAQVVRRLAVMRRLIQAGGRIAEIGQRAEGDEAEALRTAESLLYEIGSRPDGRERSQSQRVDDYLGRAMTPGRTAQAVQTGFVDLDRLLAGLHPGQLVLLAARPGVGKSALALNIARHVMGEGRRVLLASMEMAGDEVEERLLAAESGINSTRLRLGHWTEAESTRVMEAAGVVAGLPLLLADAGWQDTQTLRSVAMRHRLDGGLALVIVDYLQLLHVAGLKRGTSRYEEVTEVSRQLKLLARDLEVPVLAISQLSRGAEQRPDHEPQLSDLRESGALEQDADVVLFLYRADFYMDEEEWERRNAGKEYPRGVADLIVAKHRNGPLGRVQLVFRERTTTFVDYYVVR